MGSFNGIPAKAAQVGTAPSASNRVKLIRSIHAAARKRGLADEARHDLQVGVTGKASLTAMTQAELRQVLARLNRDSGPAPSRPHVGKVRALWWSLYWLGVVDSPNDKALDVFVRRQAGVDALRFLDHRQAYRVVEALKSWLAREGVDWAAGGDAFADRHAVLAAIDARTVQAGWTPWGGYRGDTTAALDEAIVAAGKHLRSLQP